jgi:ATP-dependent RNA helicase DeaD
MFREKTLHADVPAAADEKPRKDCPHLPLSLHKKICAILRARKDAILETGKRGGPFRSLVLSLIQGDAGQKDLKTLVLVPSPREAEDIQNSAQIQARTAEETPESFAAPDILVGTPEKIIDHLRRRKDDFSGIKRVFIDCPPEEECADFSADIQFIYSRTGFSPHTLVFTENFHKGLNALKGLLSRPRIVDKKAWQSSAVRFRYFVAEGEEKAAVLQKIIRWGGKIGDTWFAVGINGLTAEADTSRIPSAIAGTRIVSGLLEHLHRLSARSIRHVVFGHVPSADNIVRILSHPSCENLQDVVIIITEQEYPDLEKIQENITVPMEKYELFGETWTLQDFIKDIVRKVQEEEDPQILALYKKMFTQNVSFFNRLNVAACLLKLLYERKSAAAGHPSRVSHKPAVRGETKILFFGLGKNRKIFPRDITGMILSKFPAMDKSDIGDIRILDSYSFVEVAEKQAQPIIDALNGCEYRGKTLAVNYARKKDS